MSAKARDSHVTGECLLVLPHVNCLYVGRILLSLCLRVFQQGFKIEGRAETSRVALSGPEFRYK
jgi:hypothetical protein